MALIERLFPESRRRWAPPVAISLAILLVVFSEFSFRKATDVITVRNEMTANRREISRLMRFMLTAESSQRDYLLTGLKEYKQPYLNSVGEIRTTLQKIADQYAADTARRPEVERLSQLVEEKLSELETTLSTFEAQTGDWRALLLSDIGREAMKGIEETVQKLSTSETVSLEKSQIVLLHTLQLSRLGIALLVLVSLAALLAFIQQAHRLAEERETRALELLNERNRLEAEVRHRTHELTEIAKHLQNVREDERGRLARELHDELGGLLTAAKLDVARMRKKLLPDASEEVQERIKHLVSTLDAGISLKRRIIEDLRPSSLINLGLVLSLEILCAEFTVRSGIQVTPHLTEVNLHHYAQLTIYRLVQEALTNAAKYAQASQVSVILTPEQGWVSVSVKDDGIGFTTESLPPDRHGLSGMRFRVQSGNGELSIQSAPGQGTCIIARLPESTDH